LFCFPVGHDVSNAVGGDAVSTRHVGDIVCNGEGAKYWQNDTATTYWATYLATLSWVSVSPSPYSCCL